MVYNEKRKNQKAQNKEKARIAMEKQKPKLSIIPVKTDKLDYETLKNLDQEAFNAAGKGYNYILIDLESVKILDSLSIGLLVTLLKKCEKAKINLAICNIPPESLYILEVTKINLILNIYKTKQEAINQLSKAYTIDEE